MFFLNLILFLLIHSINSYRYFCDYDYDDYCIQGLKKFQNFLVNETINELRQPSSDISSIGLFYFKLKKKIFN